MTDHIEADQEIITLLTERYKAAAKQGCGAIIAEGATLADAEVKLGLESLAAFYKNVRVDPCASKTRKFKEIGRAAARLTPHIAKLPNKWTTLYHLACLTPAEFATLVASDDLHSGATWDELEAALGREGGNKSRRKPDPASLKLRYSFVLTASSVEDQREFINRLKALCDELDVTCTPSKATQAAIEIVGGLVPNGTTDCQEASNAAV